MARDEFEEVIREVDPLERARLATALLATYQQRSTELARLRRDAITEAADGRTFSQVAAVLGLSRARITQIRQTAPPTERRFFGVGPVTVAIPEREVSAEAMPGRSLHVIATEDTMAGDAIETLLTSLAFQVDRARIPPAADWQPPTGDTVIICGPKSSPVAGALIASDPHLLFHEAEPDRWVIEDRATGELYESPIDADGASGDVAYLRRLETDNGTTLLIAGVHAIGSLGAVHYLTEHLPAIYQQTGGQPFSMVVRSTHDRDQITSSEAACPAMIG